MKVAIVHYHLEPGGVTRVIENTIHAWESQGLDIQPMVITGRKYRGEAIQRVGVTEGLDYAGSRRNLEPEILAKKMENEAIRLLGGPPDLWHFHNHSLGKNSSLSLAVSVLAKQGYPILLQPHDFAEDGRPGNFRSLRESYDSIYPCSAKIHYAALNHRDCSFLRKMLEDSPSEVHLLANAIPGTKPLEYELKPHDLPTNLYLYPVRAVRRKNLGELALLSTIYPDIHFANSLGPTNPNFREEFNRWRTFAKNQNLNLTYALGESSSASFPEMLQQAEGIISTSIAEGFGLGFLEPWTFGKSLCGRNISEITKDFASQGMKLDNLYERLDVDIDLIENKDALYDAIKTSVKKFYNDYETSLPTGSVEEAYESMVIENRVDFGRLNEDLQRTLIEKIACNTTMRKDLKGNDFLRLLSKTEIDQNSSIVKKEFSLSKYGRKLFSIYLSILDSSPSEMRFADGKKLLKQFLDPKRINLLRTS